MKFINKSTNNAWVFLTSQFTVQSGKIAIFKLTNDTSKEVIIFSPTSQTDFTGYAKYLFTEDVLHNQDLPNGIVFINKALYWTLEVYEDVSYTTNLANLALLHTERVYVQPFDEECDCVNTPIELGSLNISNEPYDKDAWNGVTDIAPSKGAVRNIIEQLTGSSGGGGAVDSVNGQTGVVVLDASNIAETGTRLWLTDALKTAYDGAVSWITTNGTNILNHIINTNNPHSVTAAQVGAIALGEPAHRKYYAYDNTTVTVTGSTDQIVVRNIPITGGSMGANGKLHLISQCFKNSVTTSGATVRGYLSTDSTNTVGSTGTPTNSTIIGTLTIGTAANFWTPFQRSLINKNAENLNESVQSTISANTNDTTSVNAQISTLNIDTAVNLWYVETLQLANSADNISSRNTQIYIDKP
jgi:hypothetical protein